MTDVLLAARRGSTMRLRPILIGSCANVARLKLFNRQFTRTLESGDSGRI